MSKQKFKEKPAEVAKEEGRNTVDYLKKSSDKIQDYEVEDLKDSLKQKFNGFKNDPRKGI